MKQRMFPVSVSGAVLNLIVEFADLLMAGSLAAEQDSLVIIEQ